MPIPASSVAPSLDEFKAQVNITSTTHDDELQAMLDAAVAVVEAYVGPLDSTSVAESYYGDTNPVLLRRYPVLSVESVVDGDGNTYDADTYTLDAATGRLWMERWHFGAGFWTSFSRLGPLTVTYTAGRETVPQPILTAILIVAADLWETQIGGGAGVPSFPGAEDDLTQSRGLGMPVMPPKALGLLEPYRRGTQVA